MKRIVLSVLCSSLLLTSWSQNETEEKVKGYSVSGGLLGAANFSKFRIPDKFNSNISYDGKMGWSAGAWLNLPVANAFSIEPQLMFSSYRYFTSNITPTLLNDGKIRYISLPVLLKFHLGDVFAITAGPQVDFFTGVEDNDGLAQSDDFKKTSFSLSGGLEIMPHGRVAIFGRYLLGLTNMDNRPGHENTMEMKNQNVQAGLKLKLFGNKEVVYQATEVTVIDTDGDGIADTEDKCPTVAGTLKYNGCPIPDTDGDGINDELDKCPNEAGTAKYEGCPIPDTDGDGINDELDKCPNKAGIAKYEGCPIPDTDGDGINYELDKCPTEPGIAAKDGCPVRDRDNDGINDDEDRCPDIAGVASNKGCPDFPSNVSKSLGVAASSIKFGTGANNTTLTANSKKSLDKVVALMNEYPGLMIKVEGHTDNVGEEDDNEDLSSAQAKAVMDYIISKGIPENRISKEGFGETQPIADNNTAAGRMKNRRIEIRVAY